MIRPFEIMDGPSWWFLMASGSTLFKNFPKMNGDNLSGTTPNKGLENDADIATNPPLRSLFFFYWIQMLMTSMNDAY